MMKTDSLFPSYAFEKEAHDHGAHLVCGVDEAGRGPWAGPVVAAAVIFKPDQIPAGLNDSKKLSPKKRDALFEPIMRMADVGIGIADVARIDRDNILAATLWAMAEAVRQLKQRPDLALVDGNRAPELLCPVRTIIEGDAKSVSIAAASIIAKVTRDRIMAELDIAFPVYGFAQHKGYGTAAHLLALQEHGPCPEHRRSFKPIAGLITA